MGNTARAPGEEALWGISKQFAQHISGWSAVWWRTLVSSPYVSTRQAISDLAKSSELFRDVSRLDMVSKELEKSWKRVLKELDKEKPARDVNRKLPQHQYEKPSMNKLVELVAEARRKIAEKQDSKRGKAKVWFHKVAAGLNNHAYLFELLPSKDMYTSVLIGAFTACIKV